MKIQMMGVVWGGLVMATLVKLGMHRVTVEWFLVVSGILLEVKVEGYALLFLLVHLGLEVMTGFVVVQSCLVSGWMCWQNLEQPRNKPDNTLTK